MPFFIWLRGIKGRLLPHAYPKWPSVYWYCSQWRASGDWRRRHATLRARVREAEGHYKHPTAGCLDSQSGKTTALGRERGYDSGKKVQGRKGHLRVEPLWRRLVSGPRHFVALSSTLSRDTTTHHPRLYYAVITSNRWPLSSLK
jgi:hypothetical protein